MEQISSERVRAAKGQNAAAPATRGLQKLLIVSHVIHYRHKQQLHAYGPYAREIDIWADLFPEVTIAAPCREQAPPGDCVPFTRANISIRPLKETGGHTLKAKARQLTLLPAVVWRMCREMLRADAIHVRFPANVGLLGVVLAPLFSRYRIAKYAGQWNGYEGERLVLRLQRGLLRSRWWGSPVTVYGQWPDQPPHVVAFFTSMMTDEQVKSAIEIADRKTLSRPLRVLFSGRLAPEKRVDVLLEAVKMAIERGASLEVTILGDGRERERLESLTARLEVQDRVKFVGALPFDEALAWYDWAHCLVLPSVNSEGWPKVIAEAMCHGLICVAVKHGQVPTMLAGRGVLLDTGTAEEIAGALCDIECAPDAFAPLMREASAWARQHSLEGLRDALSALLTERWDVPVRAMTNAPGRHETSPSIFQKH